MGWFIMTPFAWLIPTIILISAGLIWYVVQTKINKRGKIMEIKKGMKRKWDKYVEVNKDGGYSECVIECTIKVGDNLDKGVKPKEAFDEGIKDRGITGFQAGCIAHGIAIFHPRGEEFRKWWNIDNQIKDEGEKANKKKGVTLNPALVTFETKK